jgi:hypothetical protein
MSIGANKEKPMCHILDIGSGVIIGGVLSALYFSSAKAFAQAELKKLRDELNALKSKAKAKL